jgi:hypothetical protein
MKNRNLLGIPALALAFIALAALAACASKAPAAPAPAAAPAAATHPESLAGTHYVDSVGAGLELDFFDVDAMEIYGLTCPYSYSAATGKGIIYDPTSPTTEFFTFDVNASGSMLTFYQEGKGVPMRRQ